MTLDLSKMPHSQLLHLTMPVYCWQIIVETMENYINNLANEDDDPEAVEVLQRTYDGLEEN